MISVLFGQKTERDSLGRGGFIRTHGIELAEVAGELWIAPITSKGHESVMCRLVCPMEHVPMLIAALETAAKGGAR